MKVFGFAATGRAGNIESEAAAADERIGSGPAGRRDEGRGWNMEEDEAEGAIQGVGPTRPAPARLAEDVDIGGNGGGGAALPQLLCLLTAEREDCAVEDLSFRTREPPPVPVVAVEEPGRRPPGPGREG